MIQFNLLPDVKLQYIRTRRRKRTVAAFCTLITGASVAILVVMFLITNVYQKVTLSSLDKEIKANTKKLQDTPDIDKILTIQNQLNSLPALHAKKPVATRLFSYVSQVTPAQVSISKLNVNFDENSMEFEGAADKLETVNKFVDTLKFSEFTTTADKSSRKAFTGVTLTNYGRDEKGATYTINLTFDPAIFSSDSEGIQLIVPKIITTRSETERPNALFVTPPPAPAPAPAGQ